MTSTHLQQWIEHPEALNRDTLYELRTLVARYPYFQSLRLLYLKNLYLLHDITFGTELRKAVLYVSDRRVLFYLIEGDRYTLQPQSSAKTSIKDLDEEPGLDRTLSLIDAFLSTIPEEHSHPAELDYAMDYTSYLLKDDEDKEEIGTQVAVLQETPKLKGQELIDGFIRQSQAEDAFSLKLPPKEEKLLPLMIEPVEESVEASEEEVLEAINQEEEQSIADTEELDDSCFTETLAKIYIKQQRYSKALEIIKKLSLNYPKKNAYFADQIRFLEKLIINAKSK